MLFTQLTQRRMKRQVLHWSDNEIGGSVDFKLERPEYRNGKKLQKYLKYRNFAPQQNHSFETTMLKYK